MGGFELYADEYVKYQNNVSVSELRKLTAIHGGGGRQGLVQRLRASRGMGAVTKSVFDPTSDIYAPIVRHGYQARLRQTEITYDPSLLRK